MVDLQSFALQLRHAYAGDDKVRNAGAYLALFCDLRRNG